jgi:carbon storage regulator CsrA
MVMSFLTQRIGEHILIDGGICVTVIAVSGDKVRLSTNKPPSANVNDLANEIRGSLAFECDWSQPAPAAAPNVPLENLAANLTDVAYRVALRHGLGERWLGLQLDLWGALTEALEMRGRSVQEFQRPNQAET